MKMSFDAVRAGIVGMAVADALGVPVEFTTREERKQDPVAEMRGYGTHRQPPGNWSDDTSMALCLMESLTRGLNAADIMDEFVKWTDEAYLTAGDVCFDIGRTTRRAIQHYRQHRNPYTCGQYGENDAGNGSLMRILPLVFYLDARFGYPFTQSAEAMKIIHRVSALTHAHLRCVIACEIDLAIAQGLLHGADGKTAIDEGFGRVAAYVQGLGRYWWEEFEEYALLSAASLAERPEESIVSSGYVVDTLTAALWCLITTDSYQACVLRAVNLGGDTDTVAAVAGGFAGLHYGYDAIPETWRQQLVRRELIETLCASFARACEAQAAEQPAGASQCDDVSGMPNSPAGI